MKKLFHYKWIITLIFILSSSCATIDKAGLLSEDELFVTRKYAGNFISYDYVPGEHFGDPHIIYIKTTLENVYGIISVYSRKCEFTSNERLYIRRVYVYSDKWGYWEYTIENDKEEKIVYPISQFEYEDKILVQNWF